MTSKDLKGLIVTAKKILIPLWLVTAVVALAVGALTGECTMCTTVSATTLMAQCLGLLFLCELLDRNYSGD